jgi:hypothetical protein
MINKTKLVRYYFSLLKLNIFTHVWT